jgi:hypothetical protein
MCPGRAWTEIFRSQAELRNELRESFEIAIDIRSRGWPKRGGRMTRFREEKRAGGLGAEWRKNDEGRHQEMYAQGAGEGREQIIDSRAWRWMEFLSLSGCPRVRDGKENFSP